MKILFLQLSDIHIAQKKDGFAINPEKLVQALNVLGPLDECVIVLSGDITQGGKVNEFKIAGDMLGNLVNKLKTKKFKNKWINVLVVPGNHDLDFTNNIRTFEDIKESYKNKNISELVNNDIKSLDNFYKFAARNKCFLNNKTVYRRNINVAGQNINIALINTAIFSLCGSSNQDMGIHYLSNEDISNLAPTSEGDLNIVVMHHSYEWFANNVKEELRDILSDKFSLVLEGHEHVGFGENRKVNNDNSTIYMQGNSLSGDRVHPKGFTTIVYDTNSKSLKGSSFIWNNDYYKETKILDELLQEKKGYNFVNTDEFKKTLYYDDNERRISNFFVFPTLSYNYTNEEEELETKIIDDNEKFIKIILENVRTVISGDNRSGKSTLAKFIYQSFADSEEEIVPLLLASEDLANKKIHRILEYAFNDQYQVTNNAYDKYLQLDKEKRVLIIDDAGKIPKPTLDKVLDHYDDMFSNIVLFSEEKIDLNIQKQVIETLVKKKVGKISIKPFLYDKRKLLISKAYNFSHLPGCSEKETQVINELNNMISSQVKYFKLDPEFIVNFVMQYTEEFKFNFSAGSNVFNMVYENSIKNRLINNVHSSDVSGIFSVMEEIAYYMHFQKKSWITIVELSKVIEVYNKDFRQDIKVTTVLNVGQGAKLIIEKDSKIRLKDNNLLAYFVAQALNKKYHYEDVNDKIEYLLNNLCFGINSDIILFMALITNNPKIISLILQCASNHFEHIEELSFDNNNIPFLCQSNFNVKNTIPDEKEKKEKEKQVVKYEEELTSNEVIQLVDEYNYDEKDITTFENQMLKSLKYIEVLSKILPAFCHNMKAAQQDELVKALYKYPNRFIYQLLKDISENYEEFISEIFEKTSEIRKEKNIAELNMESVRKMLEQMSVTLVISLYQLVASIATTKQTITALEAFDYKGNSNYSIMNLMLNEKTCNLNVFSHKAITLYDESELKLMKSLVKFTVRNYFLNHDVKLVGESQSLLDKFFGSSETFNADKKKLKFEVLKNKFKDQ
ncbi:metallophosphoesterase [Oceanirhabdus seepicola]|uniref:Metallophosphoesterase n=1 Tax=Oceanirhabdus seepicola TaxID=2828781 RepID=A0A9J6P3D0_9CLOT|nr:metallophosphoesterase [Oceanirhabdus seepicola]MCM1991167.1 metallophosphoesterase [Oceanirhabdus seepicola]